MKAECHLKKYIRELRESAENEDGEITTTVKDKVIKTSIKVTQRRLKDLNEMIDDPTAALVEIVNEVMDSSKPLSAVTVNVKGPVMLLEVSPQFAHPPRSIKSKSELNR